MDINTLGRELWIADKRYQEIDTPRDELVARWDNRAAEYDNSQISYPLLNIRAYRGQAEHLLAGLQELSTA